MQRLTLLNKNLFFIISFLILFGTVYFFFNFQDVLKAHKEEIYNIEANRAKRTAGIIKTQLKEFNLEHNVHFIVDNPSKANEINKILSYYINDEFKYVYMVYQDKDGSFRYVADGSSIDQRAELNQKFLPLNQNLWQELLKRKEDTYDIQDKAEELWLTYLSPMVINGKIECILVLDISIKEFLQFSQLLIPLEHFLNNFLVFLLVIFLIVTFQAFLFYNQYRHRTIDSLTKLYNRHYLNELISSIKRDKISLMMIDIDHFKQVNDTYGHLVGDKVLSSVAKKILLSIRTDDVVIRYGGEEFLVIVKSSHKETAKNIAKRIKETISTIPIRIDEGLNIDVTVSIGLNLHVNSSNNFKEAIIKADEMLYRAKKNGRNKIEITS